MHGKCIIFVKEIKMAFKLKIVVFIEYMVFIVMNIEVFSKYIKNIIFTFMNIQVFLIYKIYDNDLHDYSGFVSST